MEHINKNTKEQYQGKKTNSLKIMHKKMIPILTEKCKNIPVIQVCSVNILKISDVKTIKISAKIKVKNIGMKKTLNCQITTTKKIHKNM